MAQLCLTLCNPMDCSTPGLPVHHLLEFAQTHVHWVGDAIQPSHPLLSPSPPAFYLSQHHCLFQWVSSSHQVTQVLELQHQHHFFQWIFRIDFALDCPLYPFVKGPGWFTLSFVSLKNLVFAAHCSWLLTVTSYSCRFIVMYERKANCPSVVTLLWPVLEPEAHINWIYSAKKERFSRIKFSINFRNLYLCYVWLGNKHPGEVRKKNL